MPVRLIELEKLPAIDAHRDRTRDDRAVDDAGHESLAPQLLDLFSYYRATLRREFLTCHHPYLLVNPITAEPIGSRNKKTGKVEFDPAWQNDLASYHRHASRMLTVVFVSTPESVLDARRCEPYHQPNLPGGRVAEGV